MIVRPIAQRWTPRSLTNLRLWLNADDRSAFLDASNNEITNGAYVKNWKCSFFDYDFNDNSIPSKQPIWNSTGFGTKSKPYVQFDGATDILRCIDTNLLSALSADSQGSIICIFSNSNNSASSTDGMIIASVDEGTNLHHGVFVYSQGISQVFFGSFQNKQSNITSRIRQSSGVTNGSNDEVCFLATSNNTTYTLRTQTTISGVPTIYDLKTFQSGTDDGDWFDNVLNRDNVTLGGYKGTIEGYGYVRIAEIIITGTDLNGTTELDYLDKYILSKYGLLIQRN